MEQLFKFDKEMFCSPGKSPDNLKEPLMNVIKFLKRCRNIPWPVLHGVPVKTEEDHLIDIASTILYPLCNDVTLEKRYSRKLQTHAEFKAEHIGIGSSNTWHGTPDVRVRGCIFSVV